MITFASARDRNHSRLRHSSRNLPLKLSVTPFCQGLPGSINAVPIPCATIHDNRVLDTNSGPLSLHRNVGAPRRDAHRLSCKIDYFLRPNRRERSIVSKFFTGDTFAWRRSRLVVTEAGVAFAVLYSSTQALAASKRDGLLCYSPLQAS